MSAPTAKSNDRASRTRKALLDAGLELMVDRPIDAIPIDDLVSSAGVAKGSFFNHFADKADFASAIGVAVRTEIEEQVAAANRNVNDPLRRLAGGMRITATYALTRRKAAIALLRFSFGTTTRDHTLNEGVRADIAMAAAIGRIREEAREAGVLFWIGLCHAVMANIVENNATPHQASIRLREILLLGLTGMGVDEATASRIAGDASEELREVKGA